MIYIIALGLLLVATMVIVSTKIKRAAAEAYEPEVVDKPEFRIEKPAGFLYPLNAETEFPFEAYSKTYGERGTRNIWRARVRLRKSEGLNVRKLISEAGELETELDEKKMDDLGVNQVGSILRSAKEEAEVDYKILRKIVGDKSNNQTWELKTTMLAPYFDEYRDDVCDMMRSFELKSN